MTDQKQTPVESEDAAKEQAADQGKDSLTDAALDTVAGGRVGAPVRRNTRLF